MSLTLCGFSRTDDEGRVVECFPLQLQLLKSKPYFPDPVNTKCLFAPFGCVCPSQTWRRNGFRSSEGLFFLCRVVWRLKLLSCDTSEGTFHDFSARRWEEKCINVNLWRVKTRKTTELPQRDWKEHKKNKEWKVVHGFFCRKFTHRKSQYLVYTHTLSNKDTQRHTGLLSRLCAQAEGQLSQKLMAAISSSRKTQDD